MASQLSWDLVLGVRKDTSKGIRRPHEDLDINIGQDPSHRLRNTLDGWDGGIGPRIFTYTGMSRW